MVSHPGVARHVAWSGHALKCTALAAIVVAGPWVPRLLAQETYPSQAVHIIVPVPPGSAPDFLARMIGAKLQKDWGQTFVIENRPGGSQNIGAEYVARAKPDGYTLLSSPPGPLALNQYLYTGLRYSPEAFAPVTIIALVPNVLVVRPELGVADLAAFIALAKAKSDGLTYASTGTGSTLHLSAEMLRSRISANFVHVPYKGVSEIMTEFLGGRIDFAFLNLLDAFPQIEAGKLKILATGGETRDPAFPNIPPMQDMFPGFVSGTWYAITAPPGTPQDITKKLADGIRATFRAPEAAKQLADLHATAVLDTPEEAARLIHADSLRWKAVIETNHIRAE